MANPNIVAVATIKGITKTQVATASLADITAYPATGTVFKINSLIASNIHASAAKDVEVAIYTHDASSPTTHYLAKLVTVPAKASLVVVDKNSSFYLIDNAATTGQKLQVMASDVNVHFTVSYEEIS
jgi:hypothetical protein